MTIDNSIPRPDELRDWLQSIVLADLLGPANGPEEIVDERYLRDRYLIGRLGPQGQRKEREEVHSLEDAEGALATAGLDGEDGIAETESASALSMQPSSLGLSFVVSGSAVALKLTARWGRYVREKGEGEVFITKSGEQRRIWQRVPVEGTSDPIPLAPGRMAAWIPNPDQPDVRVEGWIRDRNDQWHVTLFLVNAQQEPKTSKDAACHACLFAPETSCERGNRYLDRTVLVPTVERADLAFFETGR
jgi:hypothetical protein